MVGQRGELISDGVALRVQLQQVGGEEKRRKNHLARRREKRVELAGDGGAERGARRKER